MSGDFNSDFNFDFFKEVYTGVGNASIKIVPSSTGSHEVSGNGAAVIAIIAAAEGVHVVDIVGDAAAVIEVRALAHGTHEALQPPVIPGKPGGVVVRVPPARRRRRRIAPVVGDGNAIILVIADGRGEAGQRSLTPAPLVEPMPVPAVAGRGGAVLDAHVLARGEHIDTEGWNQDFLLLVAA